MFLVLQNISKTMNKIFTAFCIFFTISCFAQEQKLLGILPLKEGKVTYTDVINFDGVDKTMLYNKAKNGLLKNINLLKM